MIKSYVISIDEIDEPSDAVSLINEKLEGLELKKNTFGVISAHADAIHSGVYKAICDILDFPVAGFACDAQGANEQLGIHKFSIMILTGDDCNFVCGKTKEILKTDEAAHLVKECYVDLKNGLTQPPKLALMYVPITADFLPGEYLEAVSSVDPKVPVFGGVSADVDSSIGANREGVFTLCDGEAMSDSVVMVLISGEIKPKFLISNFSEAAIKMKDIGKVTKCDKNLLLEINSINATEFFKRIGYFGDQLDDTEFNAGHMTTACVFDYGTDSCEKNCDKDCNEHKQLVSRTPAVYTDQGVVFHGYIKDGASISIALSTKEFVIESTKDLVKRVKESGAQTALMYSCIGRRMGLLTSPMKELEIIKEELSGSMSCMVSYTGGEICPTCVTSEEARNFEHNQTLIACVF